MPCSKPSWKYIYIYTPLEADLIPTAVGWSRAAAFLLCPACISQEKLQAPPGASPGTDRVHRSQPWCTQGWKSCAICKSSCLPATAAGAVQLQRLLSPSQLPAHEDASTCSWGWEISPTRALPVLCTYWCVPMCMGWGDNCPCNLTALPALYTHWYIPMCTRLGHSCLCSLHSSLHVGT